MNGIRERVFLDMKIWRQKLNVTSCRASGCYSCRVPTELMNIALLNGSHRQVMQSRIGKKPAQAQSTEVLPNHPQSTPKYSCIMSLRHAITPQGARGCLHAWWPFESTRFYKNTSILLHCAVVFDWEIVELKCAGSCLEIRSMSSIMWSFLAEKFR